MDATGFVKHLLAIILFAIPISLAATEITVEPGDNAIGDALIKAREMRRTKGATDITIRLESGTYHLYEPILLRREDSHTHFVAEGQVIISGGVCISGWKRGNRIW